MYTATVNNVHYEIAIDMMCIPAWIDHHLVYMLKDIALSLNLPTMVLLCMCRLNFIMCLCN